MNRWLPLTLIFAAALSACSRQPESTDPVARGEPPRFIAAPLD